MPSVCGKQKEGNNKKIKKMHFIYERPLDLYEAKIIVLYTGAKICCIKPLKTFKESSIHKKRGIFLILGFLKSRLDGKLKTMAVIKII